MDQIQESEISPTFDGVPLKAFRLAASALLTYAVNGSVRSTSDPVYRSIVESRLGPKYSSCGDLAHWFLYRLGVRAPWINRAEFKAPLGHGWRVGLNLNLLTAPPVGACTQATAVRPVKSSDADAVAHEAIPDFESGDVFLISNVWGGHCICVTGSPDPATRTDKTAPLTVKTAEYGQPGGAAKTHVITLHKDTGLLFCGANQITSYLQLDAALGADGRAAPDLRLIDQSIVEAFKQANPAA